jgi:sugar/nucleoside kinase (ribokinase family)
LHKRPTEGVVATMVSTAFAVSGGSPVSAVPRSPLAPSARALSHDRQFSEPVGTRARRARPRFHTPSASFGTGLGDTDMPFVIHELDLAKLRAERRAGTAASGQRLRTDEEEALSPSGPAVVPPVVTVGEIIFDVHYGPGVAGKTSELSGAEKQAASPATGAAQPTRGMAGGAPANLAAALARLGAMAAMVGPVGDDALGRELVETLRVRGVNTDGLQYIRGARTRRVKVHVDEQGEHEFVGFDGNNADFADAQPLNLYDCPGSLFYESEFLVCGTLSLAFPGSAENTDTLVELAKSCDLCVVVDVNWRPVFWHGQISSEAEARKIILGFLRSRADVIKVTTEEVAFLFGPDLAALALAHPELVASRG